MFGKKKKNKLIYGIVGLGRFGMALATELAESGAELIVIDGDEEKVAQMRDYTENAFVAKTLDKKTLLDTGFNNCDVAVVCIGEHVDASILVTLNLVSMEVPHVISKATSVEHGEILKKLGAEVVYPEHDMAVRLAHRLETTRVLDFVQLSEKINISKILLPPQAVGNTVLEVNLRSRFGVNIVAIENSGAVIEMVRPDYAFREKDILFLSGSKEGILKLAEWAQ